MTERTHPTPQLRRELGKWDLTAIGINQVIGGAVFITPAALALHLGGFSWIAVGLVGVLAMMIALNFAEASSRLQVESSGAQVILAGSLDPRPLLEPRLAMLLPEPVQVEGAFEIGKAKVLKHVAVSSGRTKARFDGVLRLDDFTGSGTAGLELPDASVL